MAFAPDAGLDEPVPSGYNKRVKRRHWYVVALVILLLAMVLGYRTCRQQRVDHFDRLIAGAAARYQVDPALVKAVIWCESRFKPDARGRVGEIGLMQLGEAAAWEWAAAERIPEFDHEHVIDARTNVLAGTWYLARLLKRYPEVDDPIPFALADYNAGRSHVLRWNHGEGATNAEAFTSQITFPGTRRYIEQVTRRRETYR
jgi:soluble lytic murein transglycosylase